MTKLIQFFFWFHFPLLMHERLLFVHQRCWLCQKLEFWENMQCYFDYSSSEFNLYRVFCGSFVSISCLLCYTIWVQDILTNLFQLKTCLAILLGSPKARKYEILWLGQLMCCGVEWYSTCKRFSTFKRLTWHLLNQLEGD